MSGPKLFSSSPLSARGNQRLDLQRDRIEQLARNHVVRERIADDLPVDDPRRARIVDRVLHDRPAERIGAEHASGQRRAEVAVAIGLGRHRRANAWRVRPVAEDFQVGEEERLVRARSRARECRPDRRR